MTRHHWFWVVFIGVLIVIIFMVDHGETSHQQCVDIGLRQDVPMEDWDTFMEACKQYIRDTRGRR